MKTLKLAALAGFALISSSHAQAADVLCKSKYLASEKTVLFTNQNLGSVSGDEYQEDCEKLFTPILANEDLPVVGGARTAVRFSYTLPKDDLFPMIDRFLKIYPRKTTKIEIHFWLDDVSLTGEEDMTDIRVELMPK